MGKLILRALRKSLELLTRSYTRLDERSEASRLPEFYRLFNENALTADLIYCLGLKNV